MNPLVQGQHIISRPWYGSPRTHTDLHKPPDRFHYEFDGYPPPAPRPYDYHKGALTPRTTYQESHSYQEPFRSLASSSPQGTCNPTLAPRPYDYHKEALTPRTTYQESHSLTGSQGLVLPPQPRGGGPHPAASPVKGGAEASFQLANLLWDEMQLPATEIAEIYGLGVRDIGDLKVLIERRNHPPGGALLLGALSVAKLESYFSGSRPTCSRAKALGGNGTRRSFFTAYSF